MPALRVGNASFVSIRVDETGDGIQGIAFEAVVDEEERRAAGGGLGFANDGCGGGASVRIDGTFSSTGWTLDRLVVASAWAEQEPGGQEIARARLGHGRLSETAGIRAHKLKRWATPRRRTLVEVVGVKELGAADFDGVRPASGQLVEECVEGGGEIASAGEIGIVELREFKHEQADQRADGFARAEEFLGEPGGVEEVWVHRPGPGAKACELGESFYRDGFGHLEGERKVDGTWLASDSSQRGVGKV